MGRDGGAESVYIKLRLNIHFCLDIVAEGVIITLYSVVSGVYIILSARSGLTAISR